jgi:hypothetical protein
MPIIQLRPELPKEAICKIFEKINTISSELNFFDLATAIYAAEDFSLRDDWEEKALRLKRFRVLGQVRNLDFLKPSRWLPAMTADKKPYLKVKLTSCRE